MFPTLVVRRQVVQLSLAVSVYGARVPQKPTARIWGLCFVTDVLPEASTDVSL